MRRFIRVLLIAVVFCGLFHLFGHRHHARACGGVALAPSFSYSFAAPCMAPAAYYQPAVTYYQPAVIAAPIIVERDVIQRDVVRQPRRQVIKTKTVVRTF